MKKILILVTVVGLLASCGQGKKEKDAALNDLKAKIEKLKGSKDSTGKALAELEKELAKIDTSKIEKKKLVAIETIGGGSFTHSIDLQGKVEAENTTTVSTKYGPGQVTSLSINKGDYVRAGQRILTLNNEPLKKQRLVLETQLATAKDLYQRQKNLWDQNIGAEVQVISARTQVETLERNINALDEQIRGSVVYAPISGIADVVNVRVGETFGASPFPQIQIVNNGRLKLLIEVPENYLAKIGVGNTVVANFIDVNKSFTTTITRVGQSINQFSRSYTVEASLPSGANLKPNQLATTKIIDYAVANAIVVPINIVQTDEKGKYIMVADKAPNGKLYARKKSVGIGNMYGDGIEVKQGITPGDQIIIAGYQSLFEGQLLTTN